MCFLLHRLSLLNNNQTLTWVLNELKQASKLCVTQARVGPFVHPGQRLPKTTYLQLVYYTVQQLTTLASEAVTVKSPRAETSFPAISIEVPDLRPRLAGTTGVSSALTSGPFRVQLPSPHEGICAHLSATLIPIALCVRASR